jgi:adenosylcobinamide kinase / adenosylcobinamide-phosphate guanylyltransferase
VPAHLTLVLGGSRSGKSAVAERLAATLPAPITYVATGVAADDDMAARIAAHRARRPPSWPTYEAGADLAAALRDVPGSVLVDALGTWVAAHDELRVDVPELLEALSARSAPTVVVSDEVGLGVHPSTEVGRRFRDVLGAVNEAVANIADDVWFVVAGRALPLAPIEALVPLDPAPQ